MLACVQVTRFLAQGVPTALISGEQEDINIIQGVVDDQYSNVFFTPEILLLTKKWLELLSSSTYSDHLHAVVIDEAHTVKKWGDIFRQTMQRIHEVRS